MMSTSVVDRLSFEDTERPLGLIPLVIGVTGHRDLRPEDQGALRSQVDTLLDRIEAEWRPYCPAAPIVLLTALATGADQLVADTAIKRGISIVAVLPMEMESYERDFQGAAELEGFRTLIRQAHSIIVAPSESVADDPSDRSRCYAAAGGFIVRHSSILIALWDGVKVSKGGGTSEVVRMKLHGTHPVASIDSGFDLASVGPVYQIVTPRQSSASVEEIGLRILQPDGSIEAGAARLDDGSRSIIEGLRQFNCDWSTQIDRLTDRVRESERQTLPNEPVSVDIAHLRHRYAIADTLARRYQLFAVRTIQLYMWLLLLAGLLLGTIFYYYPLKAPEVAVRPLWGIQRDMGTHWSLIVAYLGVMISIWVVYRFTSWRHFHNRYHEYRTLAEALRIQMFWRLAGVDASVTDDYPSFQAGELGWIYCALQAVSLLLQYPAPADVEAVEKLWVRDQLTFFRKAAKRGRGWIGCSHTGLRWRCGLLCPGLRCACWPNR
jgi:hypothetical protein